MPRDNIDDKSIMTYLARLVILFFIIFIIMLLTGACEFIDKGFSENPEVTLELILRRD